MIDVAAAAQPLPAQPPVQVLPVECCTLASPATETAAQLTTASALVASPLSDEPKPVAMPDNGYDSGDFWRQTKSVKWRFAGATAAIAATGFNSSEG